MTSASSLGTSLTPARNPDLLGHDSACDAFMEAFKAGRLHHAWLLTGAEGIGKATLAYHIAHMLLSNGANKLGQVDLQHPASRLIAAQAHPDLMVLERPVDEKTGVRKETIPVEEARNMAPHLRLTATHGKWRIAILDGADGLNRFGQNAILKMIEEPPPQCLILMTATTVGQMLPTIRSRCRQLPLSPLPVPTLRTVLTRIGISDGQLGPDPSRLLERAGGSVGFALKILESETLPLFDEMMLLLRTLPHLETSRLHALADKIAKKAESDNFEVLSRMLLESLYAVIRYRAAGQPPLKPELHDLAMIFQNTPPDRLLRLWESVQGIFQKNKVANLDRKLSFLNAMAEIKRAVV